MVVGECLPDDDQLVVQVALVTNRQDDDGQEKERHRHVFNDPQLGELLDGHENGQITPRLYELGRGADDIGEGKGVYVWEEKPGKQDDIVFYGSHVVDGNHQEEKQDNAESIDVQQSGDGNGQPEGEDAVFQVCGGLVGGVHQQNQGDKEDSQQGGGEIMQEFPAIEHQKKENARHIGRVFVKMVDGALPYNAHGHGQHKKNKENADDEVVRYPQGFQTLEHQHGAFQRQQGHLCEDEPCGPCGQHH